MSQSPARTLIKDAAIISMDPAIGMIDKGDLLLENGKIAAIGGSIAADDAHVIDASGAIVCPGFLDVHRHVWQGVTQGMYVRQNNGDYFEQIHMRIGTCMNGEDAYLGNYIGGLSCIETGITTVVDHCHLAHTPEKGEGAARGLIDSGVGGFFCYQISASPAYGPGASPKRADAWNQLFGPSDEWHFEHVEKLRRDLFPSDDGLLQFGIALSPSELVPGTPEAIAAELQRARKLAPKLITHHVYGYAVAYSDGREGKFRVVEALGAAGLLAPDYQASHGNYLTRDEFRLLAESGASVACCPLNELNVGPPVHMRAKACGVRSGIGIDTPIALSNDYIEEFRYAQLCTHQIAKEDSLPNSGYPPYTVSFEDTLSSATLRAAESIGLGSVTGSLTKGKRADVVLLRTSNLSIPRGLDPLRTLVGFTTIQDVDSVWVAGKLRKHNGKLTGVDVEALRIKAQKTREDLAEKAKSITFVS